MWQLITCFFVRLLTLNVQGVPLATEPGISLMSCQQQFLETFGGRHPPSKSSIWALSKKLETKGTLLDEHTGGRPNMNVGFGSEWDTLYYNWLSRCGRPLKINRNISSLVIWSNFTSLGCKLTVEKIYDSTSALRPTSYSSQIPPCKGFLTRSYPERGNNSAEVTKIQKMSTNIVTEILNIVIVLSS
jgi:hypothetical protein